MIRPLQREERKALDGLLSAFVLAFLYWLIVEVLGR
jgi:hypothetical protein